MSKKSIAAFTITRNEPFFLKIWCNYYSDSFPQEDLFILNNSSDDGSVEKVKEIFPKINVIDAPSSGAYDHVWLRQVVMDFQKHLLDSYEVVCFAETDEFLIPNENCGNIYEYCDSFRRNQDSFKNEVYLRSKGWAAIHQFNNEPNIDVTKDNFLLENRKFMRRLPFYDKTLITKKQIKYSRGFHVDNENHYHPKRDDLSLFHAWHVDLNMYVDKVSRHKKLKIVNHMNGTSNIDDAKFYFANGIERNSKNTLYEGPLVEIPEYWKKLFRI